MCKALRRAEIREIVAGHRADLAAGSTEGHHPGIGALADRAVFAEIPVIRGEFLTAVRAGDAGAATVGIVGASGFKKVGIANMEFSQRPVRGGGDWLIRRAKSGVVTHRDLTVLGVEIRLR